MISVVYGVHTVADPREEEEEEGTKSKYPP
jgi:hypothetical protein